MDNSLLVVRDINHKYIVVAKEIPTIIITHDLELLFKTCHSVLMLGDKDYKKISVKGNEASIMDFMDKKGNLLKERNYVK